VIETRPRVLDNFGCQDSPLGREAFREADFVDFVSSIRVRLGDSGVWLFAEKALNLGFEVDEMLVRPFKPQFGTVERIWTKRCHDGEVRSHERP
jgi:hypothetical protein